MESEDEQKSGDLLGDALQKAAALRTGGPVSTAAALEAAKAALDAARDARGQIANGAVKGHTTVPPETMRHLIYPYSTPTRRNHPLPPFHMNTADERLRAKAGVGPHSAEAAEGAGGGAPLSPFAAAIAAKAKQRNGKESVAGEPTTSAASGACSEC